MNKLKKLIEQYYPVQVESISLLRKRIGSVYLVQTPDKTYILKVYKDHQEPLVKRSIQAMRHGQKHGLNIPSILQTSQQTDAFYEENLYGILMDYVSGKPPKKENILGFVTLAKSVHKVFNEHPLSNKETFGKSYYIDRFKSLLKEEHYDSKKSKKWLDYLDHYYQQIQLYSTSFCHGDFHNENMIEDANKNLYLIDFDAANYTSSLIDIATITDQMDFNHFQMKDFLKTIQVIKDFLALYKDPNEDTFLLTHVLAFYPIRHAELITTITLQTKEPLSKSFLDIQYQWLEDFHQALKQVIKG